jgi:protein phosphatase 2C family protein 2/3
LVKQYSIDESKISKKPVESVRAYGANTHQGIVRNYNEDRVSIVTHFGLEKDSSFFAVYDGHGGSACADYLRDNMHKLLAQENNLVTDPK